MVIKMTENTENTEEEAEVEQMYDYPVFRDVEGNADFLEGKVGAFVEYGEPCGDYLEYDEYYLPKERVDSVSESHDAGARVQIYTVEYESPTDECGDCGDEFKSVEQHHALSECGDE